MIVTSTIKGAHAFGVGAEQVLVLKHGDNEIDAELWAAAKAQHAQLPEWLRDKLISEKPEKKPELRIGTPMKAVSVEIK